MSLLEPFFSSGLLDAEVRERVATNGDFRMAFDRLHAGRRYSDLLVPSSWVLPDAPG
jgi:hypothetical protein